MGQRVVVDGQSARKTAHIIVGEDDNGYRSGPYLNTRCGKSFPKRVGRPQRIEDRDCGLCFRAKTPCPTCGGTGRVHTLEASR